MRGGKVDRLTVLVSDFEYGPVTAVDICELPENVWLACGHEQGHVVLWDALTGRRYLQLQPN